MSTSAPRLAGYTPEVHFDCPACGQLARIVYRQSGPNVDKENPHSFSGIWRESRFGGGTVVDSVSHAPNSYPYGTTCNWRLPPEASKDPVHFVDALYQELLPYWQRQHSQHIIGLDAAKFLAGPWCLSAPAREADAAPIMLLPQSYTLCFLVKNGRMPNIRTESYQLGQDEQTKLAETFLQRIDAQMGEA